MPDMSRGASAAGDFCGHGRYLPFSRVILIGMNAEIHRPLPDAEQVDPLLDKHFAGAPSFEYV